MNDAKENDCEELTLNIPCELADRVRKYGKVAAMDLNTIMIEALDGYLRDAKQ